MVYNYICKLQKSTGEDVRRAIHLVRVENRSQRDACDVTGVTRSVLQKYLKKADDEIPDVLSQGRFKPVFTPEQENEIIEYCHALAEQFYAMTRRSLGELAFRLAEENSLDHPFKNGTAGNDWITSFLIRHQQQLSLRTGTPTSILRITSFTRTAVYKFFDQLENIIAEKNYTAATIFNADETGITIVPNKAPKRIAKTGVRTVAVMTAAERGQLVTMMCCASGEGQFIPPLFVFPNKIRFLDIALAPTGSIYTTSSRGWSTSDTFCVWLKHFRTHATPSRETPILLIIDNHSSHISYDAVKYASRNNIDMLTLPPHSTHKLQPMDVCFFGPLKAKYAQALTTWQSERRGQIPLTANIPTILKPAYEDVCKESTIKNGFKKTGIWDWELGGPNRNVFNDNEFSDTTANNEVFASTSAQNVGTLESVCLNPAPVSNDQNISQVESANDTTAGMHDDVHSVVPYDSSDDEEEYEDGYDMIDVGIQVNFDDIIHTASGETASERLEVVIPAAAATTSTEPRQQSAFAKGPWDVEKQHDAAKPSTSQRKPREKGTSQLVTSKSHIAMLKKKDLAKKRKAQSESEEAAVTRGAAKKATRTLRSASRSSSSQ